MQITDFITSMIRKYYDSLNSVKTIYGITFLELLIGFVLMDIVLYFVITIFAQNGIQKGDKVQKKNATVKGVKSNGRTNSNKSDTK